MGYAQKPVITSISESHATIDQQIVITGNDFSADAADMIVLFGGARGKIVNSSAGLIEVEVPSGTTAENIQVINKNSNLSAFSEGIFYLSFSGAAFDPSKLASEALHNNSTEYFDLCLCDFDNDGKLDVANTQSENVTDIIIYKNNSTIGNLNFSRLSKATNPELDVNSVTSTITCGDLNNDGLPDLVVTKSGNPRNVIYVFKNISSSGNIKFSSPQSLFLGSEEIAKRAKIRDLDLDGKPEIIVTNTFSPNVQIFENTSSAGNLSFETSPYKIEISGTGTTNGLVVEDLNDDGLPDIAVNPFIEDNIYVSVNNSSIGNINFNSPQEIVVAGNLNNMVAGDFNADGKIDLAVSKTIQHTVSVMINTTGTGSSTIALQENNYSTDNGPWGLDVADMDGDGKLDILVASRDNRVIDLLRNETSGSTTDFSLVSVTTSMMSRNIAGGDMDGDGKPDFVFTSFDNTASDYALSVIRNQNCYVPEIEPSGTVTVCTGVTKILKANKAVGVTYQWDRDNTVVKTGTEDYLEVTQAGVYKVVATSESGSCVKASNAVIVEESTGNAPNVPDMVNNGPFCEGATISLSTDEIANAVYEWTGPGGFSSDQREISIPDARARNAGEYQLIVTVEGCSSNPGTTVVEVIDLPEFTISSSGSEQICDGNTVQLSVAQLSGYTYQWFRGGQALSGSTGSSLEVGTAGIYSVEITQTSNSCTVSGSNTLEIEVLDLPVTGFNNPGVGCVNEEIQLISTSTFDPDVPVNFLWDPGDGSGTFTDQDLNHIFTTAGTYTVSLTVTYESGACSDEVEKTITIHDQPVFNIERSVAGQLCEGDSISLTAPGGFSEYLWSTGVTENSITVDQSGNYSLTVTDQNNCSNEVTEEVSFLPSPEVIITSEVSETAPGSEFQLLAEGALSYIWTPGNVLNDSTIADPTGIISETTTFIVEGSNADGCTDTASVTIETLEGNQIFVTPRKVFSPNGDGIDDLWIIDNIESYSDCTIMIFNGNGSTVYQASPYNNNWNAVYQGKNLPEGAYFFVIRCTGKEPKTGSVTVIR